jgi:CheY-like chemotaxis protein
LTANGHAVEVAHDGLDGIDAARRFRPEVLLCDIGLPGIDGNSIARALREESSFKNTYLIAVSGYVQDSDQQRALKAGFNAYLTKPIDFNKLERLLRKVATGESGFQILDASARWVQSRLLVAEARFWRAHCKNERKLQSTAL